MARPSDVRGSRAAWAHRLIPYDATGDVSKESRQQRSHEAVCASKSSVCLCASTKKREIRVSRVVRSKGKQIKYMYVRSRQKFY